jgi:hypothetical protein
MTISGQFSLDRDGWGCILDGMRIECPNSAMALPFDPTPGTRDPRALAILAKTIYRELRASGYAEKDVMALAGELLGMVANEVQGRRGSTD